MAATQLGPRAAIPVFFALGALVLGVALGLWGPAGASRLTELIARTPLPTPGLLEHIGGLPPGGRLPGLRSPGHVGRPRSHPGTAERRRLRLHPERFVVESELRAHNLAVRHRSGRTEVRRGSSGGHGPDR